MIPALQKPLGAVLVISQFHKAGQRCGEIPLLHKFYSFPVIAAGDHFFAVFIIPQLGEKLRGLGIFLCVIQIYRFTVYLAVAAGQGERQYQHQGNGN